MYSIGYIHTHTHIRHVYERVCACVGGGNKPKAAHYNILLLPRHSDRPKLYTRDSHATRRRRRRRRRPGPLSSRSTGICCQRGDPDLFKRRFSIVSEEVPEVIIRYTNNKSNTQFHKKFIYFISVNRKNPH